MKKIMRKNKIFVWVYSKIRNLVHFIFKGLFFRQFIINKYLKISSDPGLNFSCGERTLTYWLNSDLYNGDIYLNAKRRIPIPDSSLNKIYSHHFIEHITTENLLKLLKDFHRILKLGGKIRLVTPDLNLITKLYQHPQNIEVINHYVKTYPVATAGLAVSEMLINQGEHLVCYDFESLKALLQVAGFLDIKQYSYNISDEQIFKGIDDHGYQFTGGFSLCVEATK